MSDPMKDFPRRQRIDRATPAEAAIRSAIHEVEKMGADVRLTDAVVLLAAALDSAADYTDGEQQVRRLVHTVDNQ